MDILVDLAEEKHLKTSHWKFSKLARMMIKTLAKIF